MPKTVADAFGLRPESLEAIEHDDHEGKTEHCQLCAVYAGKCAELEGALVKCRKDLEHYKNQAQSLLLASSLRWH